MSQIKWQCRWSPTLGDLESTAESIWGTPPYNPITDQERPTVFMGLYGLPDFYALWRHKGIKHILWCGSDITNLKNGYWLEDGGNIRIGRKGICTWINKHCVSWCENEVEATALAECGIYARVQPSFLGDIDDFPLSWKPGNKVYASVSGDNFELYGWDKITELARHNPGLMFHLYGNTVVWTPNADNIVVHGRVSKERMNAEIMDMQCGLRMTEFDGMSEITVKSVLMGQWPVSLIEYPHILRPDQLSEIIHKRDPNLEGREYYRKALNNFPWNINYDV
jgi:hypothetical protein